MMKKIKIRKKATLFLASETVKMVLAVICIGVLIILGYKLYTLFMKQSAIEQAKQTLDQLVIKINNLKEGESGKFSITSPNSWYLMFFNDRNSMPKSCKDSKYCLCICEVQDYSGCDRNGVCRGLDFDTELLYYCGWDLTNRYQCFRIRLADLPIKKSNNLVFIGSDTYYLIYNRLKEVLKYIPSGETKNIEQGLEDYLQGYSSNSNPFSSKVKLNSPMMDYIKTNMPEISEWSLSISLGSKDFLGFGYSNPYLNSGEAGEVQSYKHGFDEVREYNGKKYFFKWEFNTKDNLVGENAN